MALAFFGFRAWRAQLRGTSEYQIALRVLTSLTRLHGEIQAARIPLVEGGEREAATIAAGDKRPGETDRGYRVRVDVALYESRLRPIWEARSAAISAAIEARALFGQAAQDAVSPLLTLVQELSISIDTYLPYAATGETQSPHALELLHIVHSGTGSDVFGPKVDEAFQQAEAFFRPYLTHKKGWFRRG